MELMPLQAREISDALISSAGLLICWDVAKVGKLGKDKIILQLIKESEDNY